MKDIFILSFLVISYNFLLYFFSKEYNLPLFPSDKWGYIILLSFNSALFLSWVFGERKSTVGWIAYLFVSQLAFFSILTEDFLILINTLPSLTLTLSIIWLFESPMEKRIRNLIREKERIEEQFFKNQEEIKKLTENINMRQDYISLLTQEKDELLDRIAQLQEETKEKEKLEKEYNELLEKINESESKLREYKDRLDALVEANKRLFSLIESSKDKYEKKDPNELSRLRSERKKLVKELLDLQEILEDVYRDKDKLEEDNKKLKKLLESKETELSMLKIKLEELEKSTQHRAYYYREFLNLTFENIEFSEDFIEEFIKLAPEKKREFIKELLVLNLKGTTEKLQPMKGIDKVFKLKPKGGRIYFTYGTNKRWMVLGSIDTEDDKEKERYVKDKLRRILI